MPEIQQLPVMPLARLPATQVTRFRHQLVMDLDFTLANPIVINHSFNSDMIYVSIINIGAAPILAPAMAFTNKNVMTLTAGGAAGQFRVYITVVPS